MDADLSRSLRILSGIQAAFANVSDARIVPLHYNQADTLNQLVASGSVDGVIGAFLGDRWLEDLLVHAIPMVNVGGLSAIHSIPTVGVDAHATGALAAQYFLNNGWHHTAIVHERAAYTSKKIHDGFIGASVQAGYTPLEPPSGITTSNPSGLREWLTTLPDHTGCFCTSDFLARQLVTAAYAAGRTVPESIGLLGIGDSLLDSVLSPCTLSSIVLPDFEIGRQAAMLLAAIMEKPRHTHTSIAIPPVRIIVRESSSAFRYPDPIVNKALAYIEENLFERCGIETLAQHCGASKRHLEMRFNALLGRPPAAEWNHRRHQEVCRLLADTTIPIKEIATLAGSAEASNFWNAFKKMEGITPAKYRTAHTKR